MSKSQTLAVDIISTWFCLDRGLKKEKKCRCSVNQDMNHEVRILHANLNLAFKPQPVNLNAKLQGLK